MRGEQAPVEQRHVFDVFLSHHSDDTQLAQCIAFRLEEAGLRPFIDKWHLIPGEPWQEAIESALETSRSCAVLVGPTSFGPWHHEEMRAALQRRASDPSFRVIPVLLPGSSLETRNSLPPFLRRLTCVDLTQGLDSETGFASLVSGINGTAPGRSSTPPDTGRTSWEHYDWLLQIDEYQIAYIPLLNANIGDGTRLRPAQLQLSSESMCFQLPGAFRHTRIQTPFLNDRSCRLSYYELRNDDRLIVRFSETSYADYLKSGEHLDDPDPSNTSVTLRDTFGGLIRDGVRNLRPFSLTNICGIGLFVVSSDGFAIATRHSQESHVYPGRLTFTASGTMKWDMWPDPFSQVIRKAWEEAHHQVILTFLEMVGFGADARKLYFQFSFSETHPASCAEILDHISDHSHPEAIPLEPDAVAESLIAECWEPAAEAVLLTMVAQRYSRAEMVESLRKRRKAWARRNMRDEWDYRASRPGVLPDMSVRYPTDKLNSASRHYVNHVLRFLQDDLNTKVRVVEVGGGTGRMTVKLVERVGSLTVIDLCGRMIARNKARLGEKSAHLCRYVEGFAQDCLAAESFDLALASLVFVHNVEQNDFIGLVRSICRSAPVVIVCEDVTQNRPTSPRTKIRTEGEIASAFASYGFRPTKTETIPLFDDRIWLARFARVNAGISP